MSAEAEPPGDGPGWSTGSVRQAECGDGAAWRSMSSPCRMALWPWNRPTQFSSLLLPGASQAGSCLDDAV